MSDTVSGSAVQKDAVKAGPVKTFLVTLISSLGDVADWLADDPTITAVMPSEMSSLGQRFRNE